MVLLKLHYITLLSRSQRENYGDTAIGYVELKREGPMCQVRGRVCPEHRVRSKPYTVECFVFMYLCNREKFLYMVNELNWFF